MAIKINSSTIIDDSRNIVSAGIATANHFDGFVSGGDKVFNSDTTINNGKINVALESDIIVDSGRTLTVSTGSTIVLNPFDFERSSVDELLVDKLITVGLTSSFDVVTSGIASVGITSTRLVGFGTVSLPNLAVGLLVKEIPGVIAAGTTVVSFISASPATGVSTVTISPASLNTGIQTNITFKFGTFGEEKSGIILDGEAQTIKAGNNTVIIDGENNKITIGNVDLDASNGLVVSDGTNERLRIDSSGRLLIGSNATRNTGGGINAYLQVEGTDANSSSINLIRNSNDTAPPYVSFAKSRGTTVGSASSVISGDILGNIRFSGANNNADIDNIAAQITGEVDGQPLTAGDTTDMPGRLVFYTTADGASTTTERMRIDSAGRISFQFSSTSSVINSYGYAGYYNYNSGSNSTALADQYASWFFRGSMEGTNNEGANSVVLIQNTGGAAVNKGDLIKGYTSTTLHFRVAANGNVTNTNSSYGAISDERLKQDIVSSDSQWDDIKNIEIKKFRLKEQVSELNDDAPVLLGVIAQEVENVSPGLIEQSKLEDGTPDPSSMKSVKYSVLYMKAVKALQEAMERIEILESKVNYLESLNANP